MSQYLPYIIIGLTTGSIYGLVGVGLVLTYKTSNIFNFAHGSLAAFAAFVFYFLTQEHNLPWPVALAISSVVLGPMMGLLMERLGRSVGPATTEIRVVATVGLILIILAIGVIWFPGSTRTVNEFLPVSTIHVDGVFVTWGQIIIFVFSVIVTLALYLFFRQTRHGTAMRGVVDNPDLLSRTGDNPVRVRQFAWMIGCTLAAISGVLIAPSISLDAEALTMLVLQAVGAAAIGRFSSLPMTFVGGLVLGFATALATKYAATDNNTFLNGASSALPFLILFVALIVTPRRMLIERSFKPIVAVHRSYHAPIPYRLTAGAIALAFFVVVPEFAGPRLVDYSDLLVESILILSVGLLVRHSKQISLCQLAFAAVGAAAMGHFAGSLHVPWLLALLLAVLAVVPVAALVAIPAIRLPGVFLALATFGFGIVVQQVFYPLSFFFGQGVYGESVPRPSGSIGPWHLSSAKGFYFVLLVFFVLVAILIQAITSGRLGRILSAMGDSPVVLETHGTRVAITRMFAFVISASLAALSGALGGALFGFATSTQYDPFSSLTIFVVVVIVIFGSPWYALVAAAGLTLGPAYISTSDFTSYLNLLFGISAVTYVYVARHPLTVPRRVRAFMERARRQEPDVAPTPTRATLREVPRQEVPRDGALSGLSISGLTVTFGGVVAVNDLSLTAAAGRITGLIGPNGAGKSTTFNACSGLNRRASGEIVFNGRNITKLPPDRRAQLGLGRTFQRAELLDSLTVLENVSIGSEARLAGVRPWWQLSATRRQKARTREAAVAAIHMTGLTEVQSTQVGLLPTGIRRRVEVARVLAGGFDFILMDEPSSGLDADETQRLGELLVRLVTEQQIGILLVEHDMSFVKQVCDYVHVLDFGQKIFEGSVTQMQQSEDVRAAYLGSDYAVLSG